MISIIVAYDQNRGIGHENKLPWPNMSEDMKFFKKMTSGHTVIMGRKTWQSLSLKPLPNRQNIVISTTLDNCDALVVNSLEEAIAASTNDKIFIIGGAQIYEHALENDNIHIERIIVTLIDDAFECDTFFPELDEKLWCLSKTDPREDFTILEYNYWPTNEQEKSDYFRRSNLSTTSNAQFYS